jgi:hypothetical protein
MTQKATQSNIAFWFIGEDLDYKSADFAHKITI